MLNLFFPGFPSQGEIMTNSEGVGAGAASMELLASHKVVTLKESARMVAASLGGWHLEQVHPYRSDFQS